MKIKSGTIARTIILILALINQCLVIGGHPVIPIPDELISEFVANMFTIVASVWAWWKNNSFTPEAIEADEYLDKLRNEGDDPVE